MKVSNLDKVAILAEALPYLQKFHGAASAAVCSVTLTLTALACVWQTWIPSFVASSIDRSRVGQNDDDEENCNKSSDDGSAGKTVVIKYGGAAMKDGSLKARCSCIARVALPFWLLYRDCCVRNPSLTHARDTFMRILRRRASSVTLFFSRPSASALSSCTVAALKSTAGAARAASVLSTQPPTPTAYARPFPRQ